MGLHTIQLLLDLCSVDKNSRGSTRATRKIFHRIQTVFPEIKYSDARTCYNKINWNEAEALKNAVRSIEDRRIAVLRLRPKNDVCVITQKPIKDVHPVFRYIQENGYVRAYCAESLGSYFSTSLEARDPVTRNEYTSVELRRLSRIVPHLRKSILTERMDFWKSVFTATTINICNSLLPLVVHMQEGLAESVFNLMSGQATDEALSTFFAQATYLYACSKPKYRSLKNDFLSKAGRQNEFAQQTVRFLDSVCYNLFRFHEIVFAFQGDRAVPILTDIGTVPCLI